MRADCAQHVCDRVADTTAEQKYRRKRSIFDAAPRGPLKAKMPERCGMPLAQMFILWCEQSKPGDKLFLGAAHIDRHAGASLGMLHGTPALPAFCPHQLACCRDCLQVHMVDQATRLERSCVLRGSQQWVRFSV